jgi:exopolysaccharide biosynthesis protein
MICSLGVGAQTREDSLAFAGARWQTAELSSGARCGYTQVELFGSTQSISVVRYPRRQFSTFLITLDGQALSTSELGASAGADIAVNAGYFNVKTFQSTVFLRNDGRTIEPATSPGELMRVNGMIAWRGRRGRKVDIFPCDSSRYRAVERRYRSAIACGPVLVIGSERIIYDSLGAPVVWKGGGAANRIGGSRASSAFYEGRHPRSLIGKTSDGEIVMAVIDGRFEGRGDGTTINQTAFIAQMLGLTDAINLDGGGSSTLWSVRHGVLNHPSDNRLFDHAGERAVPNCIAAKELKVGN